MTGRRFVLCVCGVVASIGILVLFILAVQNDFYAPTVVVFQPIEKETSKPEQTENMNAENILLPATVAGTPLVVEEIISYDGAYMEDLSFDEVTNVAAILLKNSSDQWIHTAEISAFVGEQKLVFLAQELPPGQSVLTLEKSRQKYTEHQITQISGVCTYLDNEPENGVVAENCGDVLLLSNVSGEGVADIIVYYKTVYADGLFYIGGRTHILAVPYLEAGKTIYLQPAYFAGKQSRTIRVEYKKSSVDSDGGFGY